MIQGLKIALHSSSIIIKVPTHTCHNDNISIYAHRDPKVIGLAGIYIIIHWLTTESPPGVRGCAVNLWTFDDGSNTKLMLQRETKERERERERRDIVNAAPHAATHSAMRSLHTMWRIQQQYVIYNMATNRNPKYPVESAQFSDVPGAVKLYNVVNTTHCNIMLQTPTGNSLHLPR